MIEKDKAIELVSKYMMVDTHDEDHFIIRQQRGKKYALIAVDEILEIVKSDDSALIVELPYWEEVRKEIEKI
jgi:hypothetical protein